MSERIAQVEPAASAIDRIPHRTYARAQTVLFVGRRGYGKTWAMRRYLEAREPRVLAFDPFNDFGGLALREDVGEALADLSYYPTCRVRVTPPVGDDSREYAEVAFGAMIDGEHPLRDALLVLDEITLWTRPIPTSTFEKLILQGRRFGIRLAVACQRISLMPGIVLSEATEMLLFRVTRPRDLDVLQEWAGKAIVVKVQSLQVGEALTILL